MVPVSHQDLQPTKCRKATRRTSPIRQSPDTPLLEILQTIEPSVATCPVGTAWPNTHGAPVQTSHPASPYIPEQMRSSYIPEQVHPMPARMPTVSPHRHMADPSCQLSTRSFPTYFPSPHSNMDSPPYPASPSDAFQNS